MHQKVSLFDQMKIELEHKVRELDRAIRKAMKEYQNRVQLAFALLDGCTVAFSSGGTRLTVSLVNVSSIPGLKLQCLEL